MTSLLTDDLSNALARFVPVPDDVARYTTDVHTAAAALQVEPAQISALAGTGLRHVEDPERGPLFDYDDIMNVGMFCGSGQTVPELGLRFLMRFAASSKQSWYSPKSWLVTVSPATSLSGADSGDSLPRIAVRVPDLRAPGVDELPLPAASPARPGAEPLQEEPYQVAVRLTGAEKTVRDQRIADVWLDIVNALADRRVIYQTVPEALRQDYRRAWELGVADCIVASKLLAERLTAQGIQARVRRGYLLGLFGSDHAWCEVDEGGATLQLDPVFAFVSMVGDSGHNVARSPEFARACFGGRFNRLLPCIGDDAAPLVYFDDEPAPYWSMVGISARPWQPS